MPTELPSPPAGLVLIIKAAGDGETSSAELARLIGREPSMTTVLLRLANSAAYGVGREVRTVQQATVVLGTRSIRNIAVSHAVQATVRGVDLGEFDAMNFWEDSLRRASAALLLARESGYEDPSEAFTVGLVQDLGSVILALEYPQHREALQAMRQDLGPSRLEQERALTGTTHPEVFASTASAWGLPSDMIQVAALHHDPKAELHDRRTNRLLQVCRAADVLADVIQTGGAKDAPRVAEEALRRLGGRRQLELEESVEALNIEMQTASRDMEIRIKQQPSYHDLMSRANEALIQINLSYEELTQKLQQTLEEKERLLTEREELARQLQRTNKMLQRLAATDVLTGVANRRAFTAALARAAEMAAAQSEPLSVLMLDIDHFKRINDTWGHGGGDIVLKELAARLQRALRPGDIVGRLGGEEFAAILPNCAVEDALAAAERLREAVRGAPFLLGNSQQVALTTSFGGTTFLESEAPTTDELLRRADVALYASKDGGRDRVTWSVEGPQSRASSKSAAP
ncbi:MAG: GGDEF domain-containing protein [Deltaproteobacteria bacterium]|nr:GGDEF domain-containing protein [Deltaproteobacteria bacterium]MCB9788764.1 GGDEF domain-containing protein [Deltaproteobacteria bacterium]